jgi:hypothetical protein
MDALQIAAGKFRALLFYSYCVLMRLLSRLLSVLAAACLSLHSPGLMFYRFAVRPASEFGPDGERWKVLNFGMLRQPLQPIRTQ